MLFSFGFYSSLLLVFFIHGVVYAILLGRKSRVRESPADGWLALFLLICVLYIAPWMLGFGGWYDTQPYRDILFYTPFQQLYLIGPVIYCYVRSLLNPGFRFRGKEWLHFLPALLYIIYSLVILLTDQWILGRYYFLANGLDPDFETWYQLTGFFSMLCYFGLSFRYYRSYLRMVPQLLSYADQARFRWVGHFLGAFLVILVLRTGFFVAGLFTDLDYVGTWWYFFAFSLLFYYIAINGYANAVVAKVPFRGIVAGNRPALLLEGPGEPEELMVMEETETAAAPNPQLEIWKEKLAALMEKERPFEDPELSLPELARKTGTNVSVLSRVVNQGFGMNFNDFINHYRVQSVLNMLKKGEHRQQTLLGIAFECGFNSKATFNRAFKKVTGMTPKDWINSGKGSPEPR